jgi:hypothetical protein
VTILLGFKAIGARYGAHNLHASGSELVSRTFVTLQSIQVPDWRLGGRTKEPAPRVRLHLPV